MHQVISGACHRSSYRQRLLQSLCLATMDCPVCTSLFPLILGLGLGDDSMQLHSWGALSRAHHKQNTGLCWEDPLSIPLPSSRLLPEHLYTLRTQELDHILHCPVQFWHCRSPSVSELQVPLQWPGGLVLFGLLAFLCFDSSSAPCS